MQFKHENDHARLQLEMTTKDSELDEIFMKEKLKKCEAIINRHI